MSIGPRFSSGAPGQDVTPNSDQGGSYAHANEMRACIDITNLEFLLIVGANGNKKIG